MAAPAAVDPPASGYPTGPRLVAGILALAVAAYFGVLLPSSFLMDALPYAALATVAVTLPLVLFLGAIALAPASVQGTLARFTKVDVRNAQHVAAVVVMAGTLYIVLGVGSVVSGVHAIESQVLQDRPDPEIRGEDVFWGLAQNAVVLMAPPLLYVALVHGHGLVDSLRALGLRHENAVSATLVGLATAFLFVLLIAVVSLFFTTYEIEMPENERALEIARSLTPLGAFALAVGSSVSEEVFFRGFLQPRIGLWGQAVVFALAHLNYVNVVQIVVTFVLGLAFGLLLQRTRNLMAPIAAHFLFNLLMLIAGIYASEQAAA